MNGPEVIHGGEAAPADEPDPVAGYPRRIICLTEETTETLYLLGEGSRIVGISGYTVRPPEARSKPKVSAFINAKFDKILALEPDLVFAFSDLQAGIASELIKRGVAVFTFNQRSVVEILQMIQTVARIVGAIDRGRALVRRLQAELDAVKASASRFSHRPRVFFEEWKDPLISGIRWVDELIELAGGETVFPDLRKYQSAKDRVVQPDAVIARDPEVILGSWCGVKVNKNFICSRPGWPAISAVRNRHVYEVKSTYILQPGPASLTEGLRQIHAILAHVLRIEPDERLRPDESIDPDVTLSKT